MTDTKTDLRRQLLASRRTLELRLRRAHSSVIVTRLAALREFASSASVLVYEPIGAEVDPRALVELARRSGKAVYRPADADPGRGWSAYDAKSGDGTEAAPVPPTLLTRPLLVVVPGVAFDPRGTRLGRGRGFYDRALARLRALGPVVAIGVAFEIQVVERLPRDPWDETVDLIATEQRVIAPVPGCDPRRIQRDVKEVHHS